MLSNIKTFFNRYASYTWSTLILFSFLFYVSQILSFSSPFSVSISWVSSLDMGLDFRFNDISLFFVGLILSFGTAVFAYALSYIKERKAAFFSILGLFLVAMLGAVTSNHIITLFIFWELTSIMSFLLIGFNHASEEGQFGARISLMVTGLGALAMLVGFLVLSSVYDTFLISEMIAQGAGPLYGDKTLTTVLILCILMGITSKSAQFPFHFWLPRAMAAPTPVSAFLHSAAMVKLGIFLVITFMPIFSPFTTWTWSLIGMGTFTMVLGIIAGFSSHSIKTILAYTTVSKLGFLIMTYGISAYTESQYGYFHILSHALYKAALFMFAGILIKLAGSKDVRTMVLPRSRPLAIGMAFATLSFASFPLTSGFVSKEIALKDVLYLTVKDPVFYIPLFALVFTSILSVAIAWRFLRLSRQLFNSQASSSLSYSYSPVFLGGMSILLGVYPQLITPYFQHLMSYHPSLPNLSLLVPFHGINLALGLSLLAIVLGSLLALKQSTLDTLQWPTFLQFEHATHTLLDAIIAKGDVVFRSLQFHNPFAFIPITLSVCLGFFVWGAHHAQLSFLDIIQHVTFSSAIVKNGIILLTMLLVMTMLRVKYMVTKIVVISLVGLFVSLLFVLWKAPDLAITQLLVDIMGLLLLLFLVRVLKQDRGERVHVSTTLSWPKVILSVGVGVMMFLIQTLLHHHRHPSPFGLDINKFTLPFAEGQNAVNTILVDFRGFDTFGEVTVLVISVMGIFSIFLKRRST